jgi:hypothetical protein
MPRGGEPDRTAPIILSVEPDALATVADARGPIRIQFNERIS